MTEFNDYFDFERSQEEAPQKQLEQSLIQLLKANQTILEALKWIQENIVILNNNQQYLGKMIKELQDGSNS